MAIAAIQWAFEQEGLQPAEKLLLVKLADNANDNGCAFPSKANLARHCGMSAESVRRYLRRLQELGYITVEERRQENINLSNAYWLVMGAQHCGPRPQQRGGGGHNTVPQGGHNTVPPNRQGEPSGEPSEGRARARAKQQRQQIPEDWRPSDEQWAKFREQYPNIDLERELELFRDHHRAKGNTFKDFVLAFHTWCKRARPSQKRGQGQPSPAYKAEDGSIWRAGRQIAPPDRPSSGQGGAG